MAGQEKWALLVVAITAIGFVVSAWRQRRGQRFKRVTGCGCGEGSAVRGSSIVISGRKGEKPRILLK